MTSRPWRVVGVNFDHMHMGDLLREVHEHPGAEIVGICDKNPARMSAAATAFGIPAERVFTDVETCLRACRPDLIILCPATADHATAVEEVAAYGADILVEKPFAASLRDADRMIAAAGRHNVRLAINWPLAWYPPHVTTKRLIDEGAIGDVQQVHFYDGNRGPLYHLADKVVVSDEDVRRAKPTSWWYKAASGGGSRWTISAMGRRSAPGIWAAKLRSRSPAWWTSPPAWRSTSIRSPFAAIGPAFRNSRPDGAPSAIPGPCSRNPNAASWWWGRRARSPAMTSSRMSGCRPERIPRSATCRRRAGGAVSQAGRVCPALQADQRADRGTAQPAALPHGTKIVDTAALSAKQKRTLELLA